MSDYFEIGEEFLEHYGVKGMKWGKSGGTASIKGPSTAKLKKESVGTVSFKKKDRSPTEASAQSTLSRQGKAKVKTEGGERQPASGDAVKTATLKQKLKKSGTDALSNQELRELNDRMNLEVQVSRLSNETKSSGQKFVQKLVEPPKPQEIRRTLLDVAKK